MHYPDLSEYEYLPGMGGLNVGWLDAKHPFEKSEIDPALLDKLLRLCLHPVNVTRGYHRCEMCESAPYPLEVKILGTTIGLGDAEIAVRGGDGQIYRAPNLFVHYIRDHRYLPPEVFLTALAECPEPRDRVSLLHRIARRLRLKSGCRR